MYKSFCYGFALVAEQVDAADLKSVGSNPVPVRFRPSAPFTKIAPSGAFFVIKVIFLCSIYFLKTRHKFKSVVY